jgi:hypothetical protein
MSTTVESCNLCNEKFVKNSAHLLDYFKQRVAHEEHFHADRCLYCGNTSCPTTDYKCRVTHNETADHIKKQIQYRNKSHQTFNTYSK